MDHSTCNSQRDNDSGSESWSNPVLHGLCLTRLHLLAMKRFVQKHKFYALFYFESTSVHMITKNHKTVINATAVLIVLQRVLNITGRTSHQNHIPCPIFGSTRRKMLARMDEFPTATRCSTAPDP